MRRSAPVARAGGRRGATVHGSPAEDLDSGDAPRRARPTTTLRAARGRPRRAKRGGRAAGPRTGPRAATTWTRRRATSPCSPTQPCAPSPDRARAKSLSRSRLRSSLPRAVEEARSELGGARAVEQDLTMETRAPDDDRGATAARRSPAALWHRSPPPPRLLAISASSACDAHNGLFMLLVVSLRGRGRGFRS